MVATYSILTLRARESFDFGNFRMNQINGLRTAKSQKSEKFTSSEVHRRRRCLEGSDASPAGAGCHASRLAALAPQHEGI